MKNAKVAEYGGGGGWFSPINFPPVAYSLNGDDQHGVIHRVDHPIVADADAIGVRATLQFLAAVWTRILRERLHGMQHSCLHLRVEFPEFLLCGTAEADCVIRHAA